MGGQHGSARGGRLYDESEGNPVSGAIMRPALAAGLAFMDATATGAFRLRDLDAWIRTRLVEPGFMPMPKAVHEPEVGSVALGDEADVAAAWTASIEGRAGRIVAVARARVMAALRGLAAAQVDDRFLTASIFAGRVARATTDRGTNWEPQLRGSERLSDMVLAVFAADILAHREDYEQRVRVCDDCGKVCFGPLGGAEPHCPSDR